MVCNLPQQSGYELPSHAANSGGHSEYVLFYLSRICTVVFEPDPPTLGEISALDGYEETIAVFESWDVLTYIILHYRHNTHLGMSVQRCCLFFWPVAWAKYALCGNPLVVWMNSLEIKSWDVLTVNILVSAYNAAVSVERNILSSLSMELRSHIRAVYQIWF